MSSSSSIEGISHLAHEQNALLDIQDCKASPMMGFGSNHQSAQSESQSILASKKHSAKMDKLPIGIRMLIYSYLPLEFLLKKVSCLSKKDREMLVSDNELLNQSRCLRISFCPDVAINYAQLKYCMLLATSYELYVEKI
jgi:hypothetical protein